MPVPGACHEPLGCGAPGWASHITVLAPPPLLWVWLSFLCLLQLAGVFTASLGDSFRYKGIMHLEEIGPYSQQRLPGGSEKTQELVAKEEIFEDPGWCKLSPRPGGKGAKADPRKVLGKLSAMRVLASPGSSEPSSTSPAKHRCVVWSLMSPPTRSTFLRAPSQSHTENKARPAPSVPGASWTLWKR